MRDSLKAAVHRFASGWWLWALVLVALPNCGLDVTGTGPALELHPGDTPHSSTIMCDIEKFQAGGVRRCATPQDLAVGVPITQAAEALVSGATSDVGLDFSPAAQVACGTGHPQAIDFHGAFPEGFPVCLNCGVIPSVHANATAVCVAQCHDLTNYGGGAVPADVGAFCAANARPSTHFPESGCFDNACSGDGTLRADFEDPRRIPEPVVWRDRIGTNAVASNLTQTSPTTVGDNFAAGAVSEQWVHAGDGYVEAEGSENDLSHIVGFAEVPPACAFPCTDNDPGFADVDFGLSLNNDGRIYILESGSLVPGPDLGQSFGTYSAGERFRVRVKDHFDGTATVSYTRVVGACLPGKACNESMVFEHLTPTAAYPMRVAAAFREQSATLANVSFVRIQ